MDETESLEYDIAARDRKIKQLEDANDMARKRIEEIKAESIKTEQAGG